MKDKNLANPEEKQNDTNEMTSQIKGEIKVRSKEKAQRAILIAVAKAHKKNAVSDQAVTDIVKPVVDALYEVYEKEGIIPTQAAFAKRCAREDIGAIVLEMPRDPFLKRRMRSPFIQIVCVGILLAATLVGIGIWWSMERQPQTALDTNGSEVVTPESNRESEKQGEKTASDGNEGSSPISEDKGPSSSDSLGSSEQQTHTHNWVPVTTTIHHDAQYKSVHHDAQYKTVHHDALTQERHICNGCGKDITGSEDAHMEAALLAGNTACGAWHTESILIQPAYDEQVLVQAAYDERVLVRGAWEETVTTGYQCSICGAKK